MFWGWLELGPAIMSGRKINRPIYLNLHIASFVALRTLPPLRYPSACLTCLSLLTYFDLLPGLLLNTFLNEIEIRLNVGEAGT